METNKQLFLMLILFIFLLSTLRRTLGSIEHVNLSINAMHVRSKGQSFKEWLFCSRFLDVIPKWVIVFYWIVLDIHFLLVGLVILGYFSITMQEISWFSLKCVFAFDLIWNIILGISTWSLNDGMYAHFERWVPKVKKKDRQKLKKNK